ncbi:MAG: hypothetical protein HRU19_14220 [Pseudobacteriovorax sp.]|nr:hypothetical protein [Pseudobacteriovorax sp.]
MRIITLLVLVSITGIGCSTTQNAPVAGDTKPNDVVLKCAEPRTTGSRIKRIKCRQLKKTTADETNAQEVLEEMRERQYRVKNPIKPL